MVKGIGNGFFLVVVVIIFEIVLFMVKVLYFNIYGGNLLVCVVGSVVLDVGNFIFMLYFLNFENKRNEFFFYILKINYVRGYIVNFYVKNYYELIVFVLIYIRFKGKIKVRMLRERKLYIELWFEF